MQLLHKLKIRAVNGSDTLLKVVKNPIEAHLPTGARRWVRVGCGCERLGG